MVIGRHVCTYTYTGCCKSLDGDDPLRGFNCPMNSRVAHSVSLEPQLATAYDRLRVEFRGKAQGESDI